MELEAKLNEIRILNEIDRLRTMLKKREAWVAAKQFSNPFWADKKTNEIIDSERGN